MSNEEIRLMSPEEIEAFRAQWLKSIRPLNCQEWKEAIREQFPQAVFEATICAAVIAQLLIKDISNPFGLILTGPPSSMKTTILNFFSEHKKCLKIDNFTPASFVSHSAKISRKKLEKVDLLPQIKDKVLIVPDLAPIFGAQKEDLIKNISILTRVFDGEGLMTASGVHGLRGYTGPHFFMMLAATTPLPPRVWRVMGNMGVRLYFLNMKAKGKQIEDYISQLTEKSYKKKLLQCRTDTSRFLTWLFHKYDIIEWNRKKDPKNVLEVIIKLAILLARLRGIISVYIAEYEDEYGEKKETIHHSIPIIENPDRAAQMLYNLARGHAVINDRTQLTLADIPILIEVTLSSAPHERIQIIRYLLEKGGTVFTTDITQDLNMSRSTVYRTMETLKLLGIITTGKEIEHTEGGPQKTRYMKLNTEFQWLIQPEFQKLWKEEALTPTLPNMT